MKITDVEVTVLRVPPPDERCTWGENALVVKNHTDAGIVGIGGSDSSPLVLNLVKGAPTFDKEFVQVGDKPGLGIQLNEEIIEKYKVDIKDIFLNRRIL